MSNFIINPYQSILVHAVYLLGYEGDGTLEGCQLTEKTSCADGPCYRGVLCTDTPSGPRCGPCPTGEI